MSECVVCSGKKTVKELAELSVEEIKRFSDPICKKHIHAVIVHIRSDNV
jgi:hypothetical protein